MDKVTRYPLPAILAIGLCFFFVMAVTREPWQFNIAVDCYTVALGVGFVFISWRSALNAFFAHHPTAEQLFILGTAGVIFATCFIRGFRLVVWLSGAPVPIDNWTFAFVSFIQLTSLSMLLMATYDTEERLAVRGLHALWLVVSVGTVLAVIVFTLKWWL